MTEIQKGPTSHTGPYLPKVQLKDYNIAINGEPIKNDIVTYENIRKACIGFGDDYITGCLLDYIYFKNTYKMILVNLNKQQVLDGRRS